MLVLPPCTRQLRQRYREKSVLIVDDVVDPNALGRLRDQLAALAPPNQSEASRHCWPWTLRMSDGSRPAALSGRQLTWPLEDYRDVVRAYAEDPAGDQGLYYWYESLEATGASGSLTTQRPGTSNTGMTCQDAGVPEADALVEALHTAECVDWLAQTTGVSVGPRPTAQATLTRYRPGAFLSPHTDWHDDGRYKLTFILFLNQDWDSSWGGCLHFRTRSGQIEVIPPTAGRMVLFEPSPQTDHWVSPVARHAPRSRNALSGWFLDS